MRNQDVDWQVKSFTDIVLNIMCNFIPNKIIKVIPRDPPWVDCELKRMLKRQQRLYRNYKRHGCNVEDKARVDAFREECKLAIKAAKSEYMKKLGNKLADPALCQKSYWKIVNQVMNKCNVQQ